VKKNISAVILAGGNSERIDFQTVPPFVPAPLSWKIVNEYSAFGCEEIIAVLNKKFS
jgi:CTP:molybdopterin cytidylyltransferase MocA